MRLTATLIAVAMGLLPPQGHAEPRTGSVAGIVQILKAPAEPGQDSRAGYGEPSAAVRLSPEQRRQKAHEDVVVYLSDAKPEDGQFAGNRYWADVEGHPSGTPAPAGAVIITVTQLPVITQINKTFIPNVLPVLIGTTVQFPNEDEIYHNVFSLSSCCKFDLGKYKRHENDPPKVHTFDAPCLARIFCDIHRNMKAHVLVLENPFFSKPDREGRFTLQEAPPGEWFLHAWHPVLAEVVLPVAVEAGREANLAISLGAKE